MNTLTRIVWPLSVLAAGIAGYVGATSLADSKAAQASLIEETNKKAVLAYFAAINAADAKGNTKDVIAGLTDKYMAPDYIQHSELFANIPGPGTDREKLIRFFQNMKADTTKWPPQKLEAIMAEGDKVMMLVSRTGSDPETGKSGTRYIFNMFRMKDGKMVEHW